MDEELWQAYRADPTPGGASEQALLDHFAPLVKMVRGRGFSGGSAGLGSYSLEAADLDQAGALGLLLAIRRYQPGRGSFEAYANRMVWGVMQHELKTADLTPKAAKGGRWMTASIEEMVAAGEDYPDGEAGLPERLAEEEAAGVLAGVLASLPWLQRAVAEGHLLGGRTLLQVARELPVRARALRRYVLPEVLRKLGDCFSEEQGILMVQNNPPGRGRPAGRHYTQVVRYYSDETTRQMSRRLAGFEGKSEAAIHRQAIREKWERVVEAHPDDPRLSLSP